MTRHANRRKNTLLGLAIIANMMCRFYFYCKQTLVTVLTIWKIAVFLLQHVPVLKKCNTWQESKVLTLEGLPKIKRRPGILHTLKYFHTLSPISLKLLQ